MAFRVQHDDRVEKVDPLQSGDSAFHDVQRQPLTGFWSSLLQNKLAAALLNQSKPQFEQEDKVKGSFRTRCVLTHLPGVFGEGSFIWIEQRKHERIRTFFFFFLNIQPFVSFWGVLCKTRWDVQSRTWPRKNAWEGDETSHLRALTGPLKDRSVQQRTAHTQQGCVPAVLGWRCLWGRGVAGARPFLRGSSALSGRVWAERSCSTWNHSSDLGRKTGKPVL